MKNLFLSLVLLIAVNGSAQTITKNLFKEDSAVTFYLFELINSYRAANHVPKLLLDTVITPACVHHTEFISVYDLSGHDEFIPANKQDIGQLTISHPLDRINYFKIKMNGGMGENCLNITGCRQNFEDKPNPSDALKWSEIWKKSITDGKLNSKAAAYCIFYAWKYSPGHNRLMLDPDMKKGSVYMKAYNKNDGSPINLCATLLVTQ